MASTPWRELITSDPQVMHGQACIDQIVEQYPSLSHDAIHACLAYAAELAHDEMLPLPAATG